MNTYFLKFTNVFIMSRLYAFQNRCLFIEISDQDKYLQATPVSYADTFAILVKHFESSRLRKSYAYVQNCIYMCVCTVAPVADLIEWHLNVYKIGTVLVKKNCG